MGLGRGIMKGRMDTKKQNQGEVVGEDAYGFLGKGGPGHIVSQVSSRRQISEKSAARLHEAWRHNDASPSVATRGQARYMGKMIWARGGACQEPQSLVFMQSSCQTQELPVRAVSGESESQRM